MPRYQKGRVGGGDRGLEDPKKLIAAARIDHLAAFPLTAGRLSAANMASAAALRQPLGGSRLQMLDSISQGDER